MAFNIFKKKETPAKKPLVQKKPSFAKASASAPLSGASADKPEGKKGVSGIAHKGIAYKVLRRPHITEKATDLGEKNQYIFEVFPRANKIEIEKAIRDVYNVDVEGVKIVNIPKKKMRLGRTEGWRNGYKKAIVKIKEGQKIEVLPR